MVGTTVSHYRVLERLGAGGMGIVYKAQDLQLDRLVALKFLPPSVGNDPEAQQRFIREARAASALDHPNICTIHEIGRAAEDQLFLCMPLYDGETVREKIDRGPLALEEAVEIAIEAAGGLAKAHAQGIIHRDIKPANVMVTSDGVVKILDFGLAKLAGMSRLTKDGSTLGTAAYMSPETVRGEEVDARSDLWSLGVMLYEMVTGQLPFRGDYEHAMVYALLNSPAQPMTSLRRDVPIELDRIVARAMAKDVSQRYPSADELAKDLRRFRKESGSHDAGEPPATASRQRRRWYHIAIPSSLVLVIAILLLRPFFEDSSAVAEPTPIAVISFANQTGDPSYDYLQEAIPNLLITSLEQSSALRVITWERMHDVLRQMGRGNVRTIDADLGFEFCRREGIRAIVVGSYIKAGEAFATDAKVLDVRTKDLLKSISARGTGVQSILTSQIDELSNEIGRGIGLPPQSVSSPTVPIAEVTTHSMEAYNLFLRGRRDVELLNYKQACGFLERAVALDSTFASAYLFLAHAYRFLIERPAANQAIEKAKMLAARAPEKERLLIEATYADYVERDPEKECALLEELTRKYPDEKRFHTYLGFAYVALGRSGEAVRELTRTLELDPEFAPAVNQLGYLYADKGKFDLAIRTLERYAALAPGDANPYDSMGEIYLRMGRLDRSSECYREAIHIQPSFYSAHKSLAYVYALMERYGESLRWIDSLCTVAPSVALRADALGWKTFLCGFAGRERESLQALALMGQKVDTLAAFEGPLYWTRAWAALRQGKPDSSRVNLDRFYASYSLAHPGMPATASALYNVTLGLHEVAFGKFDSAQAHMTQVRRLESSLESYRSSIELLAGILEAEVLLARGMPDSAIAVYRRTPVPRPVMGVGWRMPLYNIPRMRDIVPRAYLAMGKLDSAIAAYQDLFRIDSASRDRRLVDPILHYRLAQVYERAGKQDLARGEYRVFLSIWKSADHDRPELIDAKKRLAVLGQAS